jgi:ubiquinone/menaquinone biosynthesis C-methylase UbiE
MLLTSFNLGLGTCWIAACGDRKKLREILDIPKSHLIISGVTIGYPEEMPTPPKRRELNSIVHYNKFTAEKKKNFKIKPGSWTIEELADYRMRGIRATSPFVYSHKYPFKEEFKNEIKLISDSINPNGVTVDIFSFAGTYLLNLMKKVKLQKIISIEMREEMGEFIEKRKKEMKINNQVIYKVGNLDKFPIDNSSVDNVLCIKQLEKIPNPENLISEISRILKPNGNLYLSFWKNHNIYSSNYYLKTKIFKNDFTNNHYGPIEPLSLDRVKKSLTSNNLKIEEEIGLNVFPNYKFLNPLNFEGYLSKGVWRKICRTMYLQCRKI